MQGNTFIVPEKDKIVSLPRYFGIFFLLSRALFFNTKKYKQSPLCGGKRGGIYEKETLQGDILEVF